MIKNSSPAVFPFKDFSVLQMSNFNQVACIKKIIFAIMFVSVPQDTVPITICIQEFRYDQEHRIQHLEE